jgi:hypothetical protein
LNIIADSLATKALTIKGQVEQLTVLPTATLFKNKLLVTGLHTKILRQSYNSIELRDYLNLANKWKRNTIDLIWWEVHEKAITSKSISTIKRKFIQKFLHNRIPTNERQNKYYQYINPTCKNCLLVNETQNHIFRCTECPKRENIKKNTFWN